MSDYVVFVYAKQGKIKCLTLYDSKDKHDKLKKDNWIHTETLNPCRFIAYLHNSDKDEALKSLYDLSNLYQKY